MDNIQIADYRNGALSKMQNYPIWKKNHNERK